MPNDNEMQINTESINDRRITPGCGTNIPCNNTNMFDHTNYFDENTGGTTKPSFGQDGNIQEFPFNKACSARYNVGKPEWSQVDFNSFIPMVKVLEYGASKYAAKNWMKPPEEGAIQHLNSMCRHLFALMAGEVYDDESELPHIGHIMANAMFYSYHTNATKAIKQ